LIGDITCSNVGVVLWGNSTTIDDCAIAVDGDVLCA
jgi:hypothetical protein